MKTAFSFQVTAKGVFINFEKGVDFSHLREALLDHARDASDFFAGVKMYVNLNGCDFTLEQLEEIIDIVKMYNKVDSIHFINQKVNNDKSSYQKDTILIRRTIRSGQRIKYPTNVVIVGDVNPGAVVIAGGDIVVLGKLKGVVHAGADGSENAYIFALKLQPTQIRIGSIISRPPDEEASNGNFKPEKAYIKDGTIIVEEISF
ncbi:MAG: septum site-determining protein MinC [Halanaerobiales bacterium]